MGVSSVLLVVEMEGLVMMMVLVMLELLLERMLELLLERMLPNSMRPLCSDLDRKERLSIRLG